MKKTVLVLTLLALVSAFLYSQKGRGAYSRDWRNQKEWDVLPYLPGFDRFRYFMSVDEVKQIIEEDGYKADGLEVLETVNDLYDYPGVKQEFTFWFDGISKMYQLSFTTNINKLKRGEPRMMLHLRQRDSANYKIITCPAGPGKKHPKWEHKFIFYNFRKQQYKLFAIAITYQYEGSLGMFDWIHPYAYEYYHDLIRDRYGYPFHQYRKSVDKFTYKEILTYQYHHRERQSIYEKDDKGQVRATAKMLDIVTQINMSSVVFGNNRANFQVTYITPDYLRYDLFNIANQEYDDPIVAGKEIVF